MLCKPTTSSTTVSYASHLFLTREKCSQVCVVGKLWETFWKVVCLLFNSLLSLGK